MKDYFNPKGNKYAEGFDDNPRRQMFFGKLIRKAVVPLTSDINSFNSKAKVGELPTNVFAILNESLVLTGNDDTEETRVVKPISMDEYARLMSKPYKYPLKNQAWRLITDIRSASPLVEIIMSNVDLVMTATYKVQYIKYPDPIIVENLSSYSTSINNKTAVTACELDESVHEEILQRAVEIAKASYASDQSGQAQLQNQITVGQRSE